MHAVFLFVTSSCHSWILLHCLFSLVILSQVSSLYSIAKIPVPSHLQRPASPPPPLSQTQPPQPDTVDSPDRPSPGHETHVSVPGPVPLQRVPDRHDPPAVAPPADPRLTSFRFPFAAASVAAGALLKRLRDHRTNEGRSPKRMRLNDGEQHEQQIGSVGIEEDLEESVSQYRER